MQRNRRDRLSRLSSLGVLLLFLAVTPADARRYMTNGFRTAESRPQSIAILPPHAEFIKAKVVMTEEMIQECAALEDASYSFIGEMLKDKGYDVRLVTLEEAKANPELQELLRRVNERYDEEWRRIIRKPRKVKVGRYNIGEEARHVAAVLGVDGIIIARIQAVGLSGGEMTLMFLMGGYAPRGCARLDLSVINGKTGDVEGYFFSQRAAGLKTLTKKPEKIMKRVAKVTLRRYPEASEVLRPRGAGDELDEKDEGDEEKDEAALLDELEGLLGPDEPEEAETVDP